MKSAVSDICSGRSEGDKEATVFGSLAKAAPWPSEDEFLDPLKAAPWPSEDAKCPHEFGDGSFQAKACVQNRNCTL